MRRHELLEELKRELWEIILPHKDDGGTSTLVNEIVEWAVEHMDDAASEAAVDAARDAEERAYA